MGAHDGPGAGPAVTPLTLSSATKASLFPIILWRCSAAIEHGIARIRLKTSFCSATYGPKVLRPIYRDLSVFVHYQYSRDSIRHTVPIGSTWVALVVPSGFTGDSGAEYPGYMPPTLNATSATLLALARNGRSSWDVRVIA